MATCFLLYLKKTRYQGLKNICGQGKKMKVFPQKQSDSESDEDIVETTQKTTLYRRVDKSIGNFPVIACTGLLTTIASTIIFVINMNHCESILIIHHASTSTWATYSNVLVGCLAALHTAIFCHGIAVGALETSRELFHRKEIGCENCCCSMSCQRYSQYGCQITWAVVGTLLLFLLYAGLLGMFSVASMSTIFAYIFVEMCHQYSTIIAGQIQNAYAYLGEAKQYVGKADNVTKQFLMQYNRWVDLQESFRTSAMYQMSTVETPTYNGKIGWKPDHPTRKLAFDPRQSIAEGRSTMETLNQTIVDAEHRLQYYEVQFEKSVSFCTDYSSIYESLYTITIAIVVLLCGHLVMFGAHSKYFTKWYYEAKLLRNRNYE